jgi:undecaprenyl-diphosphatase
VTLLHAALLGVVQGLTEFLPISSSAHLILVRTFLGWDADPLVWQLFDVACHVGTLAAVIVYFWKDLWQILRRFDRRMWLIAVGTIPIVIIGGLWGSALEDSVRTAWVVVVPLAVGGVLMFVAERIRAHRKASAALTFSDAFVIGLAQAAALVPGVSRSGATITAGLFLGYERAAIARFSFLLAIPAIVAAAAKGALDLRHVTLTPNLQAVFAVGFAVSAIVGLATVAVLIRFLTIRRLDIFGWYRIVLSAATLLWLVTR